MGPGPTTTSPHVPHVSPGHDMLPPTRDMVRGAIGAVEPFASAREAILAIGVVASAFQALRAYAFVPILIGPPWEKKCNENSCWRAIWASSWKRSHSP